MSKQSVVCITVGIFLFLMMGGVSTMGGSVPQSSGGWLEEFEKELSAPDGSLKILDDPFPRRMLNLLYDKFLESKEVANDTTMGREKYLAILLGFKHLTKDGVLSEWKKLRLTHPDVVEALNQDTFLKEVNEFFSESDFFKKYSTEILRFSKNRWKGYSPKSQKNSPDASDFIRTFGEVDVEVLGSTHTLEFTVLKRTENPKSIVINVYTGCDERYCRYTQPIDLDDKNTWDVGLNLWDCETDIFQRKQLTAPYFKNTHASYLYAVSEFVKYIKGLYPDAKIYLRGHSFGGFFVTSYALLQSLFYPSLQDLSLIYKPFVRDGIDQLFPHHDISKIDGIISTNGGIDYLNMLKDKESFQLANHLKVPAFFSFNYDDDRVSKNDIKTLLRGDSDFIELFITREGANSYGADINENEDNVSSTTRGHFYGDPSAEIALKDAIIHFISRVGEERSLSLVQQATKKKRLTLLQGENLPCFITMKDVEQYLSNVNSTQLYIEKHGPLSPDKLLDHYLEDIDIGLKTLLNECKKNIELLRKMAEALGDEDFKDDFTEYLGLQNKSDRKSIWSKEYFWKTIEEGRQKPEFQDFYRTLSEEPEFQEKLKATKILIEKDLRKYTSSAPIWKAAGKMVRNTKFKRDY